MLLISGMLPPAQNTTVERERAVHVKELRRVLQEQYKKDFQAAIVKDKEQVSLELSSFHSSESMKMGIIEH